MFSFDERLRGLPAVKEQVVQVFQSLNQPHLAIPGRKAGLALGFVLGLRGPSGFAVFVYLYLVETGECAVYVPSAGTVPAEKYQSEEAEALGFVESMGFIMDNLNFRGRPAEEQEQMLLTLPVFQREPPPVGSVGVSINNAIQKPPTGKNAGLLSVGKLFSAFCLASLAAGCAHVSDKEREQAQFRYELSLQTLVKDPKGAFKEIETALALNPQLAEAWEVKGILLHNAFGRTEEAKAAYLTALELKPDFSEAHTNLGNLYMELKQYDQAIAEYEIALKDMLYDAPFIAHGNMGWAYFKKGDAHGALEHLKTAVTMNPKYCLGHLQLGQVYEAQKDSALSCHSFEKYREACPEQADAYQHEGVCHARSGNKELASKSFDQCVEKAKVDEVKEQCQKLKEQLAQ